jgi:hypothetical protein
MFIREMYRAVDFERLAVGSTVVTLTATKLDPINGGQVIGAFMTAETAQLRYRFDGGTVNAATNGHLLNSGDSFTIWGSDNLSQFKTIRSTGTSGVLQVTYFQA